eukprot:NODE_9512_length_1418_cov_11.426801.p1 GENE.NODE_9512_length_1418_cov_11.426801~~NODE_9512_length_1418_cov_11.426801.p1  ORF type:complete len:335 (+),score=71.16 NODE_9512_length_1418_cov_11.426801:131-1135(+)
MFDFDELPDDDGDVPAVLPTAPSPAASSAPAPTPPSAAPAAPAAPALAPALAVAAPPPAPARAPAAASFIGSELADEHAEMWARYPGTPQLSVRLAMPARMPPPESGKVKVCVLLVCGMPHKEYGSMRMEDPLPTRIIEKCWLLGLPTVRFNYSGCGASEGDMPKTTVAMKQDVEVVLQRLLERYCEKVALVAFSGGSNTAVPSLAMAHRKDRTAAYAAVSIGTRGAAMRLTSGLNEWLAEPLHKVGDMTMIRGISKLSHVPQLFVRADQDWMTPGADIDWILAAEDRCTDKDGRCLLGEHVVFPGKHAFDDVEEAPAEAVRQFLLRALTPLLV